MALISASRQSGSKCPWSASFLRKLWTLPRLVCKVPALSIELESSKYIATHKPQIRSQCPIGNERNPYNSHTGESATIIKGTRTLSPLSRPCNQFLSAKGVWPDLQSNGYYAVPEQVKMNHIKTNSSWMRRFTRFTTPSWKNFHVVLSHQAATNVNTKS